jgi:hypothetical protein
MANVHNIVDTITDKLSQYLNKPTNTNLTRSVVQFYNKNSSFEGFTNYVKLLGLHEIDKVNDIYELVRDNIDKLERIFLNYDGKPGVGNQKQKAKKNKLVLSFDDEQEDEVVKQPSKLIPFKKIPKNTAIKKTSIDFDDEDQKHEQNEVKPNTKFKKLNKQDTMRIKEVEQDVQKKEVKTVILEKLKPENAPVSLRELAEKEAMLSKTISELDELRELEELKMAEQYIEDIENDREWYMNDENDHPGYNDFDSSDYKSNITQNKPKKSRILSGGWI